MTFPLESVLPDTMVPLPWATSASAPETGDPPLVTEMVAPLSDTTGLTVIVAVAVLVAVPSEMVSVAV